MRKLISSSPTTIGTDHHTPTSGARASRIADCTVATVAPPRILPAATAQRGAGETSTSFKKPNSRSQMIDMAEKIDVNRTLMPMMPGYMKRR